MASQYAGVLGPLAFALVSVRGLLHGAGAESTLWAATLSLLGFTLLGLIAGRIAAATVIEAVRAKVNAELEAAEQQGQPASSRRTLPSAAATAPAAVAH